MESFQITLNSDFADVKNNGSISDVVFYIPNLAIDTQSYIFVSVISATIPYSFYNINDSTNLLVIFINTNIVYINIPNGNYNVNTLMNQLNISLSLYNITVSYNKTSNKFTFKCPISFIFGKLSTCFQFLGFKEPKTNEELFSTENSFNYTALQDASGNYILESVIPVNMSAYQYLYIYSNLTTYNFAKYPDINKTKLLCSIPIDVQPNGMILYKNHNNFRSNTYSSMIPDLKIQICDEDGDLIDLNDSCWSMVLQFDIVKINDEE
jgi:hypothetical protein